MFISTSWIFCLGALLTLSANGLPLVSNNTKSAPPDEIGLDIPVDLAALSSAQSLPHSSPSPPLSSSEALQNVSLQDPTSLAKRVQTWTTLLQIPNSPYQVRFNSPTSIKIEGGLLLKIARYAMDQLNIPGQPPINGYTDFISSNPAIVTDHVLRLWTAPGRPGLPPSELGSILEYLLMYVRVYAYSNENGRYFALYPILAGKIVDTKYNERNQPVGTEVIASFYVGGPRNPPKPPCDPETWQIIKQPTGDISVGCRMDLLTLHGTMEGTNWPAPA